MNGTLQGVSIAASVRPLDGPGGVLGRAGPTAVLKSDGLPVRGIMEFDTADMDWMAAAGQRNDVTPHEMARVLGSGTLWSYKSLIVDAGGSDPRFIGVRAVQEYARLRPSNGGGSIPVEADGGPGTRDGH